MEVDEEEVAPHERRPPLALRVARAPAGHLQPRELRLDRVEVGAVGDRRLLARLGERQLDEVRRRRHRLEEDEVRHRLRRALHERDDLLAEVLAVLLDGEVGRLGPLVELVAEHLDLVRVVVGPRVQLRLQRLALLGELLQLRGRQLRHRRADRLVGELLLRHADLARERGHKLRLRLLRRALLLLGLRPRLALGGRLRLRRRLERGLELLQPPRLLVATALGALAHLACSAGVAAAAAKSRLRLDTA